MIQEVTRIMQSITIAVTLLNIDDIELYKSA